MKNFDKLTFISIISLLICFIGLTQILGYAFNLSFLKGIGFSSVISPFPKVFSDVEGLETFASEFTLKLTDKNNTVKELSITPELYSNLSGPYNRRNVYGAALSYAPRLKEEVWQTVFCYAFYLPGVLRQELRIPDSTQHIAVLIKTKTRGRNDQWLLDPVCGK